MRRSSSADKAVSEGVGVTTGGPRALDRGGQKQIWPPARKLAIEPIVYGYSWIQDCIASRFGGDPFLLAQLEVVPCKLVAPRRPDRIDDPRPVELEPKGAVFSPYGVGISQERDVHYIAARQDLGRAQDPFA